MDYTVSAPMGWFPMIFSTFNLLIFLLIIGCSIYTFILFVKLAKRGIKALDIFIERSKKNAVR